MIILHTNENFGEEIFMDRQQLSEALSSAIDSGDRLPEEKIFLKLLRQVWQIDWTVAPYDVWSHMIEYDVPYFKRFMDADVGDEDEEIALLEEWIVSRTKLGGKDTGSNWKHRIIDLIDEANNLRVGVRQEIK